MNTHTHNTANKNKLQWETPVLYKEEWMNTLDGQPGTIEDNENDGPLTSN